MKGDKGFEDLKKKLKPFPNYFQLELQTVNRNTWRNVKRKLEEEEEESHIFQSDMERHRDKNLKALVYYELGDSENADRLIGEVFKSSGNRNVNASAMMALIQYKKGMITESGKIISQLEALKGSVDDFLFDEARAEMAYAYARIDATYYVKAIKLYEGVIERQPVQHKEFDFIWKFGLALTLRRCNHLVLRTLHGIKDADETSKRADELFIDIIQNCRNVVYIVRACVERATLCWNFDQKLAERLIKYGVNKAPNDHVILAKAGQVMRYLGNFIQADKYLRKSIHKRETPLALHQLGLLLKGKLKTREKSEKVNAQGSSGEHHSIGYNSTCDHTSKPLSFRQLGLLVKGEPQKLEKVKSQGSQSRIKTAGKHQSTNYNSTRDLQLKVPTLPNSRPPPRQTQGINSVKPKILYSDILTSNETNLQQNPGFKDEPKSDPHSKSAPFGSLTKKALLDSQSIPKKGELTLENENDKGSFKPVLGNSSDNPISETNNKKSAVHKDDKLNSQPIMEICPELASLSLEPKKAKDTISHDQKLDNSLRRTAPSKSPMGLFSKILKSPAHDNVAIYNKNDTNRLEECLTMFQRSYDISHGRNWNAAYDMGLTYMQMTPPKYEKAREAFGKTFECNSPLSRYKGYEQSGICLVHMSQESDSKRNDYGQDAFEMFKEAIRCWGLCQDNMPSLDNQRQYIHSLKSIRQLILGEEGRSRTKKVKEVADLHYCVHDYGESLGLYKELKDKLERSNDAKDAKDLDITKGIIKNNVKLGNFSDVLDLILILVNSQEGLESKSFILEVLLEIIKPAINNENTNLIESVFKIYRRLSKYDEDGDDVVVIYDEEISGRQIFAWLKTLSGLKVTENDDNVPITHPGITGQIELIANSEAVIFIMDKKKETDYREYVVASAVKARLAKDRRLSKIIPVTVSNYSFTSSLRAFKSLSYPTDNRDADIKSWLCSFCDIFFIA